MSNLERDVCTTTDNCVLHTPSNVLLLILSINIICYYNNIAGNFQGVLSSI